MEASRKNYDSPISMERLESKRSTFSKGDHQKRSKAKCAHGWTFLPPLKEHLAFEHPVLYYKSFGVV